MAVSKEELCTKTKKELPYPEKHPNKEFQVGCFLKSPRKGFLTPSLLLNDMIFQDTEVSE